jgi:hypothetical protein
MSSSMTCPQWPEEHPLGPTSFFFFGCPGVWIHDSVLDRQVLYCSRAPSAPGPHLLKVPPPFSIAALVHAWTLGGINHIQTSTYQVWCEL